MIVPSIADSSDPDVLDEAAPLWAPREGYLQKNSSNALVVVEVSTLSEKLLRSNRSRKDRPLVVVALTPLENGWRKCAWRCPWWTALQADLFAETTLSLVVESRRHRDPSACSAVVL